MFNSIVLIGRLTADPDMRYTQSGVAFTRFTLAVDRNYKAPGAEKKETDFINVVAWRKTAELIGQYVRKGHLLAVRGALQTRKYDDKDGNPRTATEVIADDIQFLEKRDASGPRPADPRPGNNVGPGAAPGGYGGDIPMPPPMNDMDDELPF